MIYEVRTYQLRPRAIPEFIDTFGKAYEKRKQLSKIAGFFYTDIGPLNQVIHIWPYKDALERANKRARSVKDKKYKWPPKVGHLIEDMNSELFIPAPFSPTKVKPGLGPIFEWREYQILPNRMEEVYRNWEKSLPKRLEMSPLVMAMHSDVGRLFKFVHIWAYESLDHRNAVRAEAIAKGIWPPKVKRETLKSQQSKIVLPAPFSPIN